MRVSARATPRLLPPLLLAALACANIQPPPGGPPDKQPPELVGVFPDSGVVGPNFRGDAEFRFSEVISEGSSPNEGRGTGDLERLVILSPTERIPKVSWHRSRIAVHPAEGWKPNRVYRVELLPGVADVRRNVSKAERVITFSTGAPPPVDTLRGTVIDWKAGRPSPGALVEAVLEPDSLPYRVLADSSGRFTLGPIPKGEYVVFGVLDQNKNLRRDPREAFDTVRVAPDSSDVGKLYAFVHDTLPPRIQNVQPVDSVTATITFTQSLDPFQKLDSSAARVRRLPDSADVRVVALVRPDTASPVGVQPARAPGANGAPADSTARRADSAAARRADSAGARRPGTPPIKAPPAAPKVPPKTPPTMPPAAGAPPRATPAPAGSQASGRPPLSDRLTIKVAEPWHPGDRFVIDIAGVRTVSGVTGDARSVLTIPKTPAGGPRGAALDSLRRRADSTRTPGDTARSPRDSTRARRDSTRGAPGDEPHPKER
jgi:hypothetical protein